MYMNTQRGIGMYMNTQRGIGVQFGKVQGVPQLIADVDFELQTTG